jgi:hypothetical protein
MSARAYLPILGFVAMVAGCAAVEDRPLPPDHPANPEAPEAPVPPASKTLATTEVDPIRRTPHSGHDAHSDHMPATRTPTATEQPKVVYTCPMDPEVVSDQPGRCPKCGMKLEVKP